MTLVQNLSQNRLRPRPDFALSRKLTSGLLLLLSLVAQPTPPARAMEISDLPDLVERILPSVVNISTQTVIRQQIPGWEDFFQFFGLPREHQQSSLGSGFVLDEEGYILTNTHVVDKATKVVVTLEDRRTLLARVVGKDPKLDVALLQIHAKEGKKVKDIKPVSLGNSDQVRVAEPVLAIGNPFGLAGTVTRGIISAKNRSIGLGPLDNFLQTDAAINPGNSGGPLFNYKGEVIGINSVIYSRVGQSGGLGFAIPINEAMEVVPDLKRYGRVPRPWLGIMGQKLSRRLQYYYELKTNEGILIYNLVKNAPAQIAGLKQGDVIQWVDGKKVTDLSELESILVRKKPTDSLKLKILRNSRQLTKNVRLRELPPRIDKLPQGII